MEGRGNYKVGESVYSKEKKGRRETQAVMGAMGGPHSMEVDWYRPYLVRWRVCKHIQSFKPEGFR